MVSDDAFDLLEAGCTDRQLALVLAVSMHSPSRQWGDVAHTACQMLGWLEAHEDGEAASVERDQAWHDAERAGREQAPS